MGVRASGLNVPILEVYLETLIRRLCTVSLAQLGYFYSGLSDQCHQRTTRVSNVQQHPDMTLGKGKFSDDAGMLITTASRQRLRAGHSKYEEQRR